MRNSTRSLEFAGFTLLGTPSYIWCAATHICKCGHLAHHADPRSSGMLDLIFLACFVTAAFAAFRSDLPRRSLCLSLLVILLWSRLRLDSFGGGLMVLEIPALIFLVVYAIRTIRGVWRERRQRALGIVLQHGLG